MAALVPDIERSFCLDHKFCWLIEILQATSRTSAATYKLMESYCTTKRAIESYLRVLIMCLDLGSGSWPLSREPKLIEKGWALQASTVNKSINFGTINAQRIDLGIKNMEA